MNNQNEKQKKTKITESSFRTQADDVLQYMHDFGSITPLDAMKDLGVMRLAARINDLRNRGIQITSEMVTGKNRYGRTIHYARYKKAV